NRILACSILAPAMLLCEYRSVEFMRPRPKRFQARLFCCVALGIGSSFSPVAADGRDAFHRVPIVAGEVTDAVEGVPTNSIAATPPAKASAAMPWSRIGAKASADFQGNGLAVVPTGDGARLRCVFQRLEGQATREGLWLTSTAIPLGGM